MHDMNFFSAYKRGNSGNKSFKIFLIIFLIVFLLLNGALFGFAYVTFTAIDKDIAEKQAFLSDPNTLAQIKQANDTRADVDLTSEYLKLMLEASDKYEKVNLVDVGLIDHIRRLTPTTTLITSSSLEGATLTLACTSTIDTDALDMYHAFLEDDSFVTATLTSVNRVEEEVEPSPAPTNAPAAPTPAPTPAPIITYTFSISAILQIGGE